MVHIERIDQSSTSLKLMVQGSTRHEPISVRHCCQWHRAAACGLGQAQGWLSMRLKPTGKGTRRAEDETEALL